MSRIIQPSKKMQISLFIKAQLFHQFCTHGSVGPNLLQGEKVFIKYQFEAARCTQLYPYNVISQSDLIFTYYFTALILLDLIYFQSEL